MWVKQYKVLFSKKILFSIFVLIFFDFIFEIIWDPVPRFNNKKFFFRFDPSVAHWRSPYPPKILILMPLNKTKPSSSSFLL